MSDGAWAVLATLLRSWQIPRSDGGGETGRRTGRSAFMVMNTAMFETPPRIVVPTAQELVGVATKSNADTVSQRCQLMNEIGAMLNIPQGGFTVGQSRMFVRNDIRLVGLLRRLTNPRYAANVEKNLGNASRYIDVEMLLTLAVAAREYSESVGATGTAMIETFHQGGMDHLGKNKDKLGLPRTVTNRWQAVQPYPNAEIPNKNPPGQPPSNMIYPAMIPAEDQVMAYAAQMKTSFTNAFNKSGDRYPPMSIHAGSAVASH